MDINPEENLSDLESEEETGSEDESEDEIRENIEFNSGKHQYRFIVALNKSQKLNLWLNFGYFRSQI